MSEFGRRLKAARKFAKLTQVQLAKASGVTQSSLSEAERSAAGSSFTTQLALACGVNAHWLATGEGQMLDASSIKIHFNAEKKAQPSVFESLDLLDGYVNGLAPILQDAGREVLRKWALGQSSTDEASQALQGLALASKSMNHLTAKAP